MTRGLAGRATAIAGIAAGLLAVTTVATMAQDRQIAVKWDDPEIAEFQKRAKTRGLGVNSLFDPRMAKLKLPVLGYEKPTPNVRSAFGVGAPPARRSLTMDESNPIWYEISYDYGDDIKVTVEADLRIQTKLPRGAKVYTKPLGVAPDETEISVFDSRSEVGMMGAIAEFKVYRFGQVPYSVTFECSERKKAFCQNVDAIKKDKKFLRIISARPPQQ